MSRETNSGRRPLAVRWYVILTMAAFAVLAAGLVWLYQNVFMNEVYRISKARSIEQSATSIAGSIAQQDVGDPEVFTALAYQAASTAMEYDACALITDLGTGAVVSAGLEGGNCPVAGLNIFGVQTLHDLAQKTGGSVTLYSNSGRKLDISDLSTEFNRNDRDQCLVYVTNTVDRSGSAVTVIMATILRPAGIISAALKQQLWLIGLILIVLLMIFSLILSRIITRPITKINLQAQKLAQGDYAADFDEQLGYREASELAGTLNYAASELAKVDKLKNELIANVSHDLRTPLTMIAGYGEIMRDIPGENTPENVQIIIDEANRLGDMVSNLLDLSRLQSGAVPFEMKTINFTELVKETAEHYRHLVEPDGFEIRVRTISDVWVRADEEKVKQVIYNLLNNAVNYSGESRLIEIAESREPERVRLDIIDHGIGVKEEDLPQIWDRYYRVDKEHRRSVKGTGLGLSIVKTILEKHDALYGVSSTFGKGSDFWFSFKTVPQEQSQPDA